MTDYKQIIEDFKKQHGYGHFCPKAVLFDMDGVIYDSMPNHAVSWRQAMDKVGLHMDESDAYRYEGMRGVETIKLLAREQWQRELSDIEAREIYEVKAEIFSQLPPALKMPGTERVMRQVWKSRQKVCVVTGSGQHTLLEKLLEDYKGLVCPRYIVNGYDVKHGKPDPEPYQVGMEKTGTQPWEAVAIENAPLGIESAVTAGCFTIAINTGPLPDEELLSKGAHLIFPSMMALAKECKNIHDAIFDEESRQDMNWLVMYDQIMDYMEKNHRRPSKYYIEDRQMFNWIKYNRRRYHRGLMSEKYREKFEIYLETAKKYYRINQFG